jgi:hypothetical protein
MMHLRKQAVPARGVAGAALLGLLATCSPADREAGGAAPPPAAGGLRFAPAQRDCLDLAVGEKHAARIALVSDQPVDWKGVVLASSCDCLTADYVGTPEPSRAEIEMTWFGEKVEDVDGSIYAENPRHETLAEFRSRVVVARIPFVQPREVAIERRRDPTFEFVVGQAFPAGAELPGSILADLDIDAIDETRVVLEDFEDETERHESDVILRTRIRFAVVEEALAKPFETEIPVEFGQPPVKRKVRARWPGR